MRTTIAAIAIAIALAGCTLPSALIQLTPRPTLTAFNDESYVWEPWYFSTNKVDSTAK